VPYEAKYRAFDAKGGIRWVATRGEVIRDEDGEPVRMIGINRDVTDYREALDALARANADLEQKVEQRTQEAKEALERLFEAQKMEAVGQLTGGVAHDFNNLLMATLGSLGLLRKRLSDDPKAHRLLENAIQAAERGAMLTQRLLAFARRQELKPRLSRSQLWSRV
jgi:signal transduction histidine kinase